MSKKVGFPVMSVSMTGILFILALLLASLTIMISGFAAYIDYALINALLFFIAAFLAGWALLSFALHPALDETQRLIAAIFTGLLLLVYMNAGVLLALGF